MTAANEKLILKRLEDIETKIEQLEDTMAATQADLDTAITNLQQTLTALTSSINAAITKLGTTTTAADLTNEVTALGTLATSVTNEKASLDAAVNPVPHPAPAA